MSRRLRILYHHRTQGRGAEGNHIVSIVTGLRALGHEVDVLSPSGVDPFDPAATVPVDKAKTKTRGWSSLWKNLSKHLPGALFEVAELLYNVPAYVRVRNRLRRHRYDVVLERYAFYLWAGAYAAGRAHCRFILEVNEVSGVPGRARRQAFPRLCAFVERRLLRRCDLVQTVSSYLADRVLIQGVPPRRVVMVPNGFDCARIAPQRSREQMRRDHGLQDALVVGFAGWFDHWDRLDFLIEVFDAVQRGESRLRLCLVGDGPGLQEAKLKAVELGVADKLVCTGAVPRTRVYDFLQMFDIGILPHSNVFGSPIIMFELMGLNVPLVLPRLPPIEDVHADGQTALLFEPLDEGICAAQLNSLVASPDLRAQIARRAHEKLLLEHSWTHTAGRIVAALDRSG
jgi:glycosyltransferase involved in cell wall biosynthesis